MLIVSLISSLAAAFAPDETVYIGQEPVRIWRYHADTQRGLRQAAAWQSFLAGEGAGWKAKFDERTGTAHRAWGPSIPLGGITSTEEAAAALISLFERYPDLLGVDSSALRLGKSGYDEATDTWYIHLDAMVSVGQGEDVPVWRGGVTARIRQDRLMLLGIDTYPEASAVAPQVTLSDADALQVAVQSGPAPQAEHTAEGARLVVLPREEGGALTYHLCWEIRTRTATPPGLWVSFVDAQSGELLNVHNEVRFLSGYLYATHDTRTLDGNMTTSALPWLLIEGDGASTSTDVSGAFSLKLDAATAELKGEGVAVFNESGDDGSLSLIDGDNTWTTANATQAEIDSYVFLHHVRDWADLYAPHVNTDWAMVRSYVNINSACNAYFDGNSVNFYLSGKGCNNTGQIADVNYHEWGHGFHLYNLLSGEYDGSIGEGIGDTVAFFQTRDPIIAPYFMTDGSGIREVSTDRVYPDDWVGEVHYDGLIFAGAIWDLWNELTVDLGTEAADETLFNLFVAGLRGGPQIPDTYEEFLVADDDNADLSDGTPNQCALIDAFSRHGLGPGSGQGFVVFSHEPLGNQLPTVSEYTLEADLVNLAEGCEESEVTSAKLYYSTDNGDSWQSVGLDLAGESVTGAIPAQPDGTRVLYYLSAQSADGEVTAPVGGSITPLSFYVGEMVELYCEDFEDGDGGYTSELIDGEDSPGADDWMWGTPAGMGGDPDFAYSGTRVWGNDLGGTIDGQEYNGEYQNEKVNRLSSSVIDLQGYQAVVVQFQRWLSVEDGFYDRARVLVGDEVAWENHGTNQNIGDEHHEDSQWALQTLLVNADGAESLTLGWEIETDGGLTMGGWNIDDVCVYGVSFKAEDGWGDDVDGDDGDTAGEDSDSPLGEDDDLDGEIKPVGCGGCATGQSGAPWAMGLWLAGLAWLRRRRE